MMGLSINYIYRTVYSLISMHGTSPTDLIYTPPLL